MPRAHSDDSFCGISDTDRVTERDDLRIRLVMQSDQCRELPQGVDLNIPAVDPDPACLIVCRVHEDPVSEVGDKVGSRASCLYRPLLGFFRFGVVRRRSCAVSYEPGTAAADPDLHRVAWFRVDRHAYRSLINSAGDMHPRGAVLDPCDGAHCVDRLGLAPCHGREGRDHVLNYSVVHWFLQIKRGHPHGCPLVVMLLI